MTTTRRIPISIAENRDCMEAMKGFEDKFFDLAIVDPEYGRGEHGGVNRTSYALQKNGAKILVKGGDYKKKNWDLKPPSSEYFDELIRISHHQIIWGVNYYKYIFRSSGRIIWDKVNDGSDQSSCEIAYYSGHDRVDLFRYMWRGMLQGRSAKEGHLSKGDGKKNEKRIHPTQKPLALYFWLLKNYAKPGDKILDTHMGSQSSRIAAYKMGFDFWGYEIDEQYFREGCKRFDKAIAEPLFDQPKIIQPTLL
jgi:site-specific DNA-methyltransferase (adenine-specific)